MPQRLCRCLVVPCGGVGISDALSSRHHLEDAAVAVFLFMPTSTGVQEGRPDSHAGPEVPRGGISALGADVVPTEDLTGLEVPQHKLVVGFAEGQLAGVAP